MPALPRAALLLLLLLLLLCSLLAARAQVNPGKWKLGSSQRLRGWGTASGRATGTPGPLSQVYSLGIQWAALQCMPSCAGRHIPLCAHPST